MRRSLLAIAVFLAMGAWLLLPMRVFADENVTVGCCTCKLKSGPAQEGLTCITVPTGEDGNNCASLPTKHANLQDYTCTGLSTSQLTCVSKAESASGICTVGPKDVNAFDPKTSEPKVPFTLTPPSLQVAIPGLVFANSGVSNGRTIAVPFFAQYVSAIYKYLTVISAVAAAVMIVYGGFLMIFAQTGARVRAGREIITDAIIGLLLVMGAYVILDAINPRLTTLTDIKLTTVETVTLEDYHNLQSQAANEDFTPDEGIAKALRTTGGGLGTRQLPNNPFDQRASLPPEELDELVRKIAADKGVDPCIPLAIIQNESGGRQNAIGHDEDAPLLNTQSRLDFLRGKVTYSGKTFADTKLPETCNKANANVCEEIIRQTAALVNDDALTTTAPDFGLDWKFSHGFGVGQFTIPKKGGPGFCTGKGDGAYGVLAGGKCLTVPILLTWEGQLEAMMNLIKQKEKASPCATFCSYGGLCELDPECTGTQLSKRMKSYEACKGV